jgi:hypothetical protein
LLQAQTVSPKVDSASAINPTSDAWRAVSVERKEEKWHRKVCCVFRTDGFYRERISNGNGKA